MTNANTSVTLAKLLHSLRETLCKSGTVVPNLHYGEQSKRHFYSCGCTSLLQLFFFFCSLFLDFLIR